jgi:hypothetical protein
VTVISSRAVPSLEAVSAAGSGAATQIRPNTIQERVRRAPGVIAEPAMSALDISKLLTYLKLFAPPIP